MAYQGAHGGGSGARTRGARTSHLVWVARAENAVENLQRDWVVHSGIAIPHPPLHRAKLRNLLEGAHLAKGC
eukprot:CAMPEP_0206297488 /NCGR_PEP_ID=MMETSP0106_2-20121207/6198_1 /ASSEMBLY_ACC=CAM_ASM_000206 /TAXON_ID=81532 /ORGANISM="Acanthoeca-like sp., Strain 10tr" /LENGTH=71 /DNA_ID=CAMNT_0053728155 /DNA_START=337 /DNA_END=552 /DNA_ORIENTATION=+